MLLTNKLFMLFTNLRSKLKRYAFDLYGLPNNQFHKLQRVQNAAARLICNVSRFDHITPSLCSLHWLPIIYRIQFKISLFVFKAFIRTFAA